MLADSFTGHTTGNAILACIGIARGQWSTVRACLLAVGAFLCGTALGSVWPGADGHGPCRRLAQPLAAEIVLIVLGTFVATPDTDAGRQIFVVCLCVSLGVQNGILSKIGSLSVHSTFITGMSSTVVTTLAHGKADPKLWLLLAVIGCFVTGAFGGGWMVDHMRRDGFVGLLILLAVSLVLALTAPRDETA